MSPALDMNAAGALLTALSQGVEQFEELRRRASRGLFADYCKYMWLTINPGTTLHWERAHDAICEHAEAVVLRDVYSNVPLVVSCPPGIGKTFILSICLPTFAWLRRPEWRIFGVSHSIDLALAINVDRRDLIEDVAYQWLHPGFALHQRMGGGFSAADIVPVGQPGWTAEDELDPERFRQPDHTYDLTAYREARAKWAKPVSVHLEPGQKLKSWFRNNSRGWIQAISIGSRLTGKHCDLAIIDDPVDADPIGLERRFDQWWDWFTAKFQSRFRNKEDRRIILVMQRLGAGDPAERLLSEWGADHLNLPNEMSRSFHCPCRPVRPEPPKGTPIGEEPEGTGNFCQTKLGWRDWRRTEGELLTPALLSRERTEKERDANPRAYQIQYNQQVALQDGGIINPAWFGEWVHHTEAVRHLGTMDPTGGSMSSRASYLVIMVWALLRDGRVRALDQLRMRADEFSTRHALELMIARWPACADWLVEEKVLGKRLVAGYQRRFLELGVNVRGYDPGKDSKETRAKLWTEHAQRGLIELPSRAAERPAGLAPARTVRGLADVVYRHRGTRLADAASFAKRGNFEAALRTLALVDVPLDDEARRRRVEDGHIDPVFLEDYDTTRRAVVGAWNHPAWPDDYRDEARAFPSPPEDQIDATSIMGADWMPFIGRPTGASSDAIALIRKGLKGPNPRHRR